MDCRPPGSSVYGIFQARILECVAIPFSRESSQPRDRTCVSCIGRKIVYCWATSEALNSDKNMRKKLLLSSKSLVGAKLNFWDMQKKMKCIEKNFLRNTSPVVQWPLDRIQCKTSKTQSEAGKKTSAMGKKSVCKAAEFSEQSFLNKCQFQKLKLICCICYHSK